ncbi:MAG: phosphoribosylamine--glycine ligase [bacterium]
MNILIVGSGGREHALAWKIKQSPKIKNLFIAPGNPGTAKLGTNLPIKTKNEILDWLKLDKMDLVLIGPDNFLAEGIVDEIEKLGIPVFGPTKKASEIEWSKSFAKQFMLEENIPTANFKVFNNFLNANKYIETQSFPLVIKASGLALGKGVIIAKTLGEAKKTLEEIMSAKIFGEAGNEVVIEEFLVGKEISTHAFCDGENITMFPSSQDHKTIFEGDLGPNTGGMGTIAPVPWVTEAQVKEIENLVIKPTITALKRRGKPFKGILFPGIMITESGPKVIEFNARFGDPETESYMRLLKTDLVDILLACTKGKLNEQKIEWENFSACTIMCASEGYPGSYEKGKIIHGLENSEKDIIVFHAGTLNVDGKIVTNGGRVLGVSATGNDLKEALGKAYDVIENISFDGMQWRKDIGAKSV